MDNGSPLRLLYEPGQPMTTLVDEPELNTFANRTEGITQCTTPTSAASTASLAKPFHRLPNSTPAIQQARSAPQRAAALLPADVPAHTMATRLGHADTRSP